MSLAALASLALLCAALQEGQALAGPLSAEEQRLVATLAEQGVHVDPRRGLAWIATEVVVRDDLLEYLLTGPGGALHETLLATRVPASVVNVALLALGAEPGVNASWRPVEPPPTEDALRAGAPAYDVTPPTGDGFLLYAGWREGDEVFLYRVEDLLRDLSSGRSMRRHRWVYLGSRMVRSPRGEGEVFAADLYQNLVNVAFFSEGHTLLTAAIPEALEQTIWLPNAWLLPERGAQVALVFAREPLERVPPELAAVLPAHPARGPGPAEER